LITALVTMFVVGFVPLMPTEPVLVGMGVFAAQGKLPLFAVIATATVACVLSDHMLYFVGRTGGAWAIQRLARRPSVRAAHDWLTGRITRWGAPVLVIGRWLPAGGTIGDLLAGTLRWRLLRFMPVSIIGSALWCTYVAMIGFFGGAVTDNAFYGVLLSLGVAAVLGVALSFVIPRTHRRRPVAQPPPDAPEIGEEPLVAG
jgi:membrane protein DedA with SNARE-associated domain